MKKREEVPTAAEAGKKRPRTYLHGLLCFFMTGECNETIWNWTG